MVKNKPTTTAEATVAKPKPKPTKAAAKVDYKPLATEENANVAIDVTYAGDTPQASVLPKTDGFGLELKVRSSRLFAATRTVNITEGKYAGYSAILIKPASAFPYMKLPMEIRDRIQKMLLLPQEPLQIKAKSGSGTRQAVTAANYSAKNRLALLRVNKQIRQETFRLVYGDIQFSADTTTTFTKFLICIGSEARSALTNVSITNYMKKDIHMLFILLPDCKHLGRLHLNNFHTAGNPGKVARAFLLDAGSWISARVSLVGKDKALKPLHFAPRALSNGAKAFTEKEIADFYEELEKKM